MSNTWQCVQCTLQNDLNALRCIVCDKRRPRKCTSNKTTKKITKKRKSIKKTKQPDSSNGFKRLSKQQKEILSFGFARKHSLNTIPAVIITLCLLYFNEICELMINEKELKKLIETSNHKISSKIFNVQNILFQFIVYSNGKLIACKLLLTSIPSEIQYIDICYELFCVETKSAYKDYLRFTKDNNCSNGFLLQRDENIKMTIEECKKYNILTFECDVDILNVKTLNDNHNDYNMTLSPSKYVSVTVCEGILERRNDLIKKFNLKPWTPFKKQYKLNTKIKQIFEDSIKYFKYPFPIQQLLFNKAINNNHFVGQLDEHNLSLMEYLSYIDSSTSGRRGPTKLFTFAIRLNDKYCGCPVCSQNVVMPLSYGFWKAHVLEYGISHLAIYGATPVYCINDEWKCGSCWLSDPKINKKLYS